MKLNLLCFVCAGVTYSVCAAQTFTIEADIRVRVASGRIVTDAIDDATGNIVPDVQYFGYEFQEDPKNPYFIQDPGFVAPAGSGLPPFSSLGFNVVRHLAYWNGSGAVSFTTPPNSESLRWSFGAASVTVNGSSGVQNGFTISNVAADGSLHRHLNAFLLGADITTDPTEGVYFTNIRLSSSDGSITPSDSLYIVYNNGASESAFDAALEYLTVPLPGDANFDGVVGLQDFNILAANFGQPDRFWYQGDFNGDRQVTLADFNALAGHFGQSNAAFSIPEPAVLCWAAWLLLMARPVRCPNRQMTAALLQPA